MKDPAEKDRRLLDRDKAWDLAKSNTREARPSRKLDEMKRALAGWAQTQLPHVRAMCGSLVSLSFGSPRVYSAIQERDDRKASSSVQPTRGIAYSSTFSPASFSVGTCFPKI